MLKWFSIRLKTVRNDSTANVIHIDFNLLENEKYAEYHSLYDFVKSQYKTVVKNYLLIDEIQNCDGFEKAINALHASEQFDYTSQVPMPFC